MLVPVEGHRTFLARGEGKGGPFTLPARVQRSRPRSALPFDRNDVIWFQGTRISHVKVHIAREYEGLVTHLASLVSGSRCRNVGVVTKVCMYVVGQQEQTMVIPRRATGLLSSFPLLGANTECPHSGCLPFAQMDACGLQWSVARHGVASSHC